MKMLILLFITSFGLKAFAGPFSLQNCTGPADLCTSLEAEINKNLPNADATSYLKGMANSLTLAGKGTGADYATDYDWFVVTAAVGAGADAGGAKATDVLGGDIDTNNLRGVGAQATINVGVNLAVLPWDRIWFLNLNKTKLYFNTFSYSKTSGKISGKTETLGMHIQYKLIDGHGLLGWKMLHWGGLDFTTGFESAKLNFNYSETVTKSTTVSGQTATYSGPIGVSSRTSTVSVPFELSTNVQWLYLFTTYIGTGLDFNSGKSTVDASSTGTISGAISATGKINLGQEGKPNTTDFRYFVGQQINLPLVKIFAQLNQSLTNDTVGAAAGVKIAW